MGFTAGQNLKATDADHIETDGVKRYVALLTEVAPATITAGPLVVGMRYTITTFVAGDDFTNVGAASNANGVIFIATGATPTVYSNGSTLDSDGAPIATVLENTLGGTLVWTRNDAGTYFATLIGVFPVNKVFAPSTVIGTANADGILGFALIGRADNDTMILHTFDTGRQSLWEGDPNPLNYAGQDGLLTSWPFTIIVYP